MNEHLDLEQRLIAAHLPALPALGGSAPEMPADWTAQDELSQLHGKELGLLAAEAEALLAAAAEGERGARGELILRAEIWSVAWNADRAEYANVDPRTVARLEELAGELEALVDVGEAGALA